MKRREVRASALEMFAEPWSILDARLEAAIGRLLELLDAEAEVEIDAALTEQDERARKSIIMDVGSTRVIRIHGVMVSFDIPQWLCDWFGACVTGRIQRFLMEAEENPMVDRIVLDIDSPGGMVGGVSELAKAVTGCETPVHAHAKDICASAAYWVASGADRISCDETALVGSVGVRMVVARVKPEKAYYEEVDFVSQQTPRKAMNLWHPDDEKREQARRDAQTIVDTTAEVFIGHVTAQRGDHNGNLDGRVFVGEDAVASGYADVLSTLATVLSMKDPSTERQMENETDTTAETGTEAETGTDGQEAQEAAAAAEASAEEQRVEAIAALPIPDALKWKATREGMTALEAMTMAYDAKGTPAAGGELEDRAAAEAGAEHPAAGQAAAAGDGNEKSEFLAMFRKAGELLDRGRGQATLVNPSTGD